MSELLLVEATEDLQTLAEGLTRGGFHVTAQSLREAVDHVSGGALVDVLIVNLTEGPPDRPVRELLASEALSLLAARLAIVRRDQVAQLDVDLPIDDFVVAPAPADEAIARIQRSLRRRSPAEDAHLLHCGDLTIDQASYKVYAGSRPIELTFKEYELLRFLALNPDKVHSRETLLNRVWGYDFYGGARTVDVHIRRLRSKIEDSSHSLIETVRNVGYRLRAG
jgi:DNA-binding response OmpR family regulator